MTDVQNLEKKVDMLLSLVMDLDTVDTKYIAKDLGVSEAYIRGDGKHLLPFNGVSEFEGKPARWRRTTWQQKKLEIERNGKIHRSTRKNVQSV